MKNDDIEDIYSELETFSKIPPAELWDNIEARLHPKKKKRRVIFFWSSAAAVLVMLLGYVFTNSLEPNGKSINEISDIELPKDDDASKSNKETIKIVEVEGEIDTNEDTLNEKINATKKSINNKTNQEQGTNKKLNNLASQKQSTNRNKIIEQKEAQKNDLYKKSIDNKKQSANDNNRYAQNYIKENDIIKENDKANTKERYDLKGKNKDLIDSKKEKLVASNDSITKVKAIALVDLTQELLAENKNDTDSIATNKVLNLKWSVEVLGGLANTASDASIQGTSVNTTSQNGFVYTLKVGYALSDRLVVKSGIGKNRLGQEINNIKYIGVDATLMANDPQSIVNNQEIIFLVSDESINDFNALPETTNEGKLQQQFDYVQIPLEFSYNIIKAQKFDISLGVGGNVNFLTNNRAYLDNEQIGENIGANATIFGAMLNTNISYGIAKKMNLFLEPSYNYFDKPVDNNNQTFNNTQLRVLFGLRYKF